MRALSRYIRSRALVTSNWSRQHCEPEPDALQRTGGFLMQANDASGADDARREDEALLDDDDQQLPNVYTTCSVCHRTVQVHLARSSPHLGERVQLLDLMLEHGVDCEQVVASVLDSAKQSGITHRACVAPAPSCLGTPARRR